MRRTATFLSLAFTAILPFVSSFAVATTEQDEHDLMVDVLDVRDMPPSPGTGKTAIVMGTTNIVRSTPSGYEIETTTPGAYEITAYNSDVNVFNVTKTTDLPLAEDRADAALAELSTEIDATKGMNEWVIVVGRLVILDENDEPISEELGTFLIDGNQVRVKNVE